MTEIPDYQQRVLDEGFELKSKMEKLGKFLHTEMFDELPKEEQDDLREQLKIMIKYLNILTKRIVRFKK